VHLPNGGFMAASEKGGIPYREMIHQIVKDALNR
jgi:hypothetical protein